MSLQTEIERQLAQTDARISRVDYDSRRYWVKRRERLSWRMRLQKGDAARAFDAERSALDALGGKSLPVAQVVSSGADWIAIEDGGTSLADLLRRRVKYGEEGDMRPFEAAGEALARFHASGISHGRPAIKDILWDGAEIRLIDFERYSEARNTLRWHALDVIFFVHSFLSIAQKPTPELDHAVAGYLEAGGAGIWSRARRSVRRIRWLKTLLAPIRLRKPGRGKDVRAVLLTLEYMTAPPSG